ncbi:MAG: zf-HC2 domain-containing protein [Candidatus Zixiibacteriota bacterium]
MRCRKVRSYLSAYSNGEMTGRDLVAVREHLSTCAACRREESAFSSIRQTLPTLATPAISADFNTKLLNRIARERFAETRTRAYLPHRAPALSWRQVLVGAVSVVAVALVAVSLLRQSQPIVQTPQPVVADGMSLLDDSYLTAQPYNNPNLTVNVQKDWSLNTQLARAERAGRISGQLTRSGGFGAMNPLAVAGWYSQGVELPTPFGSMYIEIRPIVRVYQPVGATPVTEVHQIY